MSKKKCRDSSRLRSPATGGRKNPPAFLQIDLVFLLILLLAAFAIRYVSLDANGVTFDEPTYIFAGTAYIDNVAHLNSSALAWVDNNEHPPVSKYLYGLAAYLLYGTDEVLGAFMAAKLVSVVLGVLTCGLVYLIGREFLGRKIGFVAGMVLALLPTFIAHTQIAALESPLAFFCTLTVYLYMLAVKRDSNTLFLISAAVFGLVVSTKYNGVLLLPVLGLFFLAYQLRQVKDREGSLNVGKILANPGILFPAESVITFLGIAAIIFFILWPWLWSSPISNLRFSLDHWNYPVTEYFLGAKVAPPLYYYPVYFAVTLPALLFIPLAAGVLAVLKSRDPFEMGILFWFLVPFAYGLSGFVQDGIRYIFIIYPAVALLCALGLGKLAAWIGTSVGARFKAVTPDRAFSVVSALTVVYLLAVAASVYPYYIDYYNELTGGAQNVQEHRLFKFGWWGEGLSECMNWIGARATAYDHVIMLTQPEDQSNTMYYMHDQYYIYPWPSYNGTNKVYSFTETPYTIKPLGMEDTISVVPEYVIINQKAREDFNISFDDPGYTLVYQATVQGAPIAQVYRRTG